MFQQSILYPGVLYPTMTFGIYGKKKLYRCRPFEKDLPDIYLAYTTNESLPLYILFEYKEEDQFGKPIGMVKEKIGPINVEENFYKYQLHCYSLVSKPFPKQISKAQNEILKSRNCWNVFTIDPETTRDYDDAFSIRTLSPQCHQISIYIANVPILLEKNNLWGLLNDRVSTIYLPNQAIPLLPKILSEDCCSLQENKERMCFVMDVIVVNHKIDSVQFDSYSVIVKKNFVYEEPKLLKNRDYKLLKKLTENLFSSGTKVCLGISSETIRVLIWKE